MPHPDPLPDDFDLFAAMSDHLADEALDADVQAAAHAYHAPPPVPADAMWAAIQARRASAAPGTPDRGPANALADPPQRGRDAAGRRAAVRAVRLPLGAWGRAARRWTPLAAAAAALLAVGVGLGRYSASPNGSPNGSPAELAAARTGAPAAAPSTATRTDPLPNASRGGAVASAGGGAPRAHRVDDRRDVGPPATVAGAAAALAPDAPDATSAPLRAAADQHLADAEALLTAFGAADGGGQRQPAGAAPDSAWARDLLTTTRLLLDSPAGRDPARRSLLETLELVLVQIARLPHADTPAERALIERAIRNGDLMARLRTAVPSGPGHRGDARGT